MIKIMIRGGGGGYSWKAEEGEEGLFMESGRGGGEVIHGKRSYREFSKSF